MKPIRISLAIFGAIVLSVLALDGCSVYMAAKQPDKKDLGVLSIGSPRSRVLAELGNPLYMVVKGGKRIDVFSFVQGYSKGTKTGRALFHGAADMFTLGAWELIGTPTEVVLDGTKMAFEVQYDMDDKVEKVTQLSGPGIETSVPKVQAEKTESLPVKKEKVEVPVEEVKPVSQ